jgi:hypothetical protein
MKARRVVSANEKRIRDKEIRRQCVAICNQFELDYDTMAIYILHYFYGFGAKRIEEYHRHLIEERNELKEFYEADDKDPYIHFYAMRQKLKADGIDVEALRDKLMKESGDIG